MPEYSKENQHKKPVEHPKLNGDANKYWGMSNNFKIKIQQIPELIATTNNNVDFSSGRYQEIMIDTEGCIETLEFEFYQYCEEVEKLFKQPDLTIDKCIEYLMGNASKFNSIQYDDLLNLEDTVNSWLSSEGDPRVSE